MKRMISLSLVFLLLFTMMYPLDGPPSFADDARQEMKGLWVATVLNIDYPSKATTDVELLKKEADAVMDTAKDAGLNAIFLQVRPTADAIYPSKYFPWSKYLTGRQGLSPADGFDPLAYWIDGAHKRGLELHAWINPYRITKKTAKEKAHDFDSLSPDHPARLHPDWVVKHTDGNLYFNPGIPEVRQYIIDSILELSDNYAVDGIHFDDYFYPGTKFADTTTFKMYGNGYVKIDDWRRNNVTLLIKGISDALKTRERRVSFGISPFGIWANRSSNPLGSDTNGLQSYQDHYADTRAWVKSEIIDYIAPQLYWNIGFKVADYSKLLTWWSDVVNGTSVKLYIGHAAYRSGNTTSGSPWAGTSEIKRQIELNAKTPEVSGSIFYNYTALKKSPALVKTIAQSLSAKNVVQGTVQSASQSSTQPSAKTISIPSVPLSIAKYGSTVKVSSSGLFLSGTSDPSLPLLVNGKSIENRSPNGYFGYFAKLSVGRNTLVFSQGNTKKTITITRSSGSSSASSSSKKSADITSPFPSSPEMRLAGSKITLSCLAPVGSTVTVEIAGKRYPLKPTLSQTRQAGVVLTRFSTTYALPTPTDYSKPLVLGNPVYRMSYKGASKSKTAPSEISSLSKDTPLYAVITQPVVDTYKGPTTANGSNAEVYSGMTDRIIAMSGKYIGLSSGLWIKNENAQIINEDNVSRTTISNVEHTTDGIWDRLYFKTSRPLIANNTYDGKTLTVTFGDGGQDSLPSMPVLTENCLFEDIQFSGTDGKSVFKLIPKSGQTISGYVVKGMYDGVVLEVKRKASPMDISRPLQGLTILVDPGHGGSDTGALGPRGAELAEKHINLSVSLALEKKLIEAGANVVMTRKSDIKVTLAERLAMSRNLKPDLFISVHADSIDDFRDINQIKGFTVYHNPTGLTEKASENVLQKVVNDLGRKSRGVKQMNFYVTKGSWSPAMLIETGFVPNPHEFDWLTDEQSVESLASKITEGLSNYYSPAATATR